MTAVIVPGQGGTNLLAGGATVECKYLTEGGSGAAADGWTFEWYQTLSYLLSK